MKPSPPKKPLIIYVAPKFKTPMKKKINSSVL
jgi:hypothetical protein